MSDTFVLLTLDALRADHCSTFGYDRETTPRLTELASDGISYSDCVAQSSHTRESMPSLLYSAYPGEFETVGVAPTDRRSVAEQFSESGFTTAGFHSNPYLSRAYGFDAGFETFDDDLPRINNRIVTFLHRVRNYFDPQPYVRGADLAQKGLRWLEETAGERRFLWLHFMDPHGPYQPPPEYQRHFLDDTIDQTDAKRLWRRSVDEPETLDDDEIATLRALYDAEIRYTDDVLGDFVTEIRRDSSAADATIVVAADHGDAFGEHGLFGHPRHLYEELVQVPLFVFSPKVRGGQHVSQQVSNVDVVPTLLELADIDAPETVGTVLPGVGETADSERVVFSEAKAEDRPIRRWAARDGAYKYYAETDEERAVVDRQLWRLDRTDTVPTDDPPETRDVTEAKPEVRARLAAELDAHIDAVSETGSADTRERTEVDDVVEDRLDDLGYR